MTDSLKNKTVKGVGWSAIDNITQYGVNFIVSIVLARILSPDDYGLIGLIAIFTAVCTTLINAGFGTALIRKNNTSDEDFNTAFIVNMIMSFLLYFIIFFCSPLIAGFFQREELVWLTRVSALGLIIGALSLVQQTRLTKRIDFKSQTKITIVASISSGIIGITLALMKFGVWALVVQTLSSQLIRTALLWHVNKWIPQLSFSKKSFHELFSFGWKMMLSGVIDTFWKELYQFVVGKFYSPATLGQYTRARQFSQLLSSNVTGVVQRVTYPVLSSIQEDKLRMVKAFKRMIKTTMFVTSISMFFLGAISDPLLYCLIGPKWHDAAIYLPFICIVGSWYPLQAINLNMLQVLGRSDLFLGLEIVKKVIGLGPILIGIFVGIIPMLCASILTSIIAFFLNSYYTGKILGYTSWMQIKDILPSYGVAISIAISVFFIKFLLIPNWATLLLQLIVGVGVLFIISYLTKIEEFQELKNIFKSIIQKNIKRHE